MNKQIEALKRMYRNDIKFHEKKLDRLPKVTSFMTGYSEGSLARAKEYLAIIEEMEKQDEN